MKRLNATFDIADGEYHSFDSYYKNVILANMTLIIPYINLGIINHPLNPSTQIRYINKCYIIFSGLKSLEVYKKGRLIDVGSSSVFEYFFGGLNLDTASDFIDMDIRADAGVLMTLPDTTLSDGMWVPIETPNLKSNMDERDVELFFDSVYALEI